jgi:glycosyltransferase involved in cell wall biosynthesis
MHGMRFCAATLHLARLAREHRIDLIHSHLTCATYHGVLAGMLTRLPVVSSVHVLSRDFVYRWLLPRAENRIITVSEAVRQGLLRRGVPPMRIQTIYNGTDFLAKEDEERQRASADSLATASATTERERRERQSLPVHVELSLPPDAELIGLFGHVGEFKGHFLLAEAAKQVVAARPRAFFLCVGAVNAQTQRQLWEIAAAGGAADRLRFTGLRDDVRRLMTAMDVITLPSRFEACSMSIIEAMALGKPVIATHAGGNPELVQDQQTGLLIKRSAPALAEALISLLSDRSRLQQMGAAGRARAAACFSAEVMTAHIEQLYQEMLCSVRKAGNRARQAR